MGRGGGGAVGVDRSAGAEPTQAGLMELDQVDSRGRRWRKFSTCGEQLQVNMSVLEPYLHVLSHGGQRSNTLHSYHQWGKT